MITSIQSSERKPQTNKLIYVALIFVFVCLLQFVFILHTYRNNNNLNTEDIKSISLDNEVLKTQIKSLKSHISHLTKTDDSQSRSLYPTQVHLPTLQRNTQNEVSRLHVSSCSNALEHCREQLSKAKSECQNSESYDGEDDEDRSPPRRGIHKQSYLPTNDLFSTIYIPKLNKKSTSKPLEEWASQAGQDKIVIGLLSDPPYKRNGYYVDIAAHDAISISNTAVLDRNFEWKGICAEAAYRYWYGLSYQRNCHVIGGAISDTTGESVPFRFQNEFGGIISNTTDQKPGETSNRMYAKCATQENVGTVRLTDVLEAVAAPRVMDYLSLDVEGAESWVMSGFDWNKYKFMVITVERPKRELRKKLDEHGYVWIGSIPHRHVKHLDEIYIHHTHPRADKFIGMDVAFVMSTLPDYPL